MFFAKYFNCVVKKSVHANYFMKQCTRTHNTMIDRDGTFSNLEHSQSAYQLSITMIVVSYIISIIHQHSCQHI